MHQPGKLQPIAIGTLVIVVISFMPILNLVNFIFCAGVIAGAVSGVYAYNKKLPGTSISLTYKDGAIIGGASGAFSAVIFIGLLIAAILFLKILNVNLGTILKDVFSNFGLGPNRNKLSKKMIDEYSENGFSVIHIVIVSITYGIMYPLFGILGGIIGSAIFISRNKSIKQI